jgi:hypothetical protein
MLKHLLLLGALSASTLIAQTCPDRTLGTFLGTGDDTMFGMQSIGFAFPFGGTTYTDVHVCANGYFFLSNNGVPAPAAGDYSSTPAELAAQSPRVAVLWNDLNLLPANNAGAYVNATPAKCTITWDNVVCYGLPTMFQLQAQLLPSGEIWMFWSEGATNNSTFNYAAGSGLTGVSAGLGIAQPPASGLSTQGTAAVDIVFEQWQLQHTFDLAGRSMHWIPTTPGWAWIPGPWIGCAQAHDFGIGCVESRDSFYEMMTPATFDLVGTHWTLQRNANGYTATNAPAAAFVAPGVGAAVIANADDTTQLVTLAQAMPVPGGTTTQLTVSSNGNIALAGIGNGAGFAPDPGLFLAFAQTSVAASWHDYNPTIVGSGSILFEQVGTHAYVTWNGVYSYNSTLADKFQYQFNLVTGDVTIVYDTFGLGATDYLVGYSRGGTPPRTEAIDVSLALATPYALADTGVQGLTLTTTGPPLVGNAGFGYAISRIPAVSPVGIVFFGDAGAPGLDLTFLGMPGCRAYTNANLTSTTFVAAQPAGTGTQPLPIPASTGLIGVALYSQAIAFTLSTPANLCSSNGTHIDIGL